MEKLSRETLSSRACEWLDACGRRGVEGCGVDGKGAFEMKLDRRVRVRGLEKRSCGEVLNVDAKSCLR
ncbi:MAG: hypothetical protein U0270_12290 [Labilithrix sp.]